MEKIVIVTRCLLSGGAERVISQIADYVVNSGISCSIIMLDKYEIFYKTDARVKLYTIGELSENKILNRFLKYKKVRKIVKETSPDIVLTMPEDIGIYVVPAMLGSGIPVVVSERNNPWVMPYSRISRMLRKVFYPFAAGYIFQTKQAASFFSKKIQKKGVVLPNPLDLSRIPQPYEGVREKIIAGAGRLDKQKNFPLLIDAFADFYKTHKDYKLVIYGEGHLREELVAYANSKLAANTFEFPGRVQDLTERLNSVSAFVLSSDYEGMPNVLIEAMSMGVPSISTDCPSGGSAELIKDGVNGFLVPVGDKDALLQKLCELIDSAELSKTFSENSVSIKENLDAHVICRKWIDYLAERVK